MAFKYRIRYVSSGILPDTGRLALVFQYVDDVNHLSHPRCYFGNGYCRSDYFVAELVVFLLLTLDSEVLNILLSIFVVEALLQSSDLIPLFLGLLFKARLIKCSQLSALF